MKRPFAVIGFTVFLSIAFLFDKKTGVTAAALAGFAVALVIALFSKSSREAKVFPLFASSGAVACIFLLMVNTLYYLPLISYDGSVHRLKARITDEAVMNYGKFYYDAQALSVDGEDVRFNLRLTFSKAPDISPYDIIEGDFAFYRPGMTDSGFLSANLASGLVVGAYPFSEDCIVTEIPEDEKPFGIKIINMRTAIKRAVYRVFPDENGALAVAMLLGDKSGISDSLYNDLRLAGIVHIICVSGFHLSLWSTFVIGLLRKTRLSEKLISVIASFAVIGFMLIAGLTYSVQRAGVMMLSYLLANFFSRRSDSINSLGISLLVISVAYPYAMASVSLQLSALSTVGILLCNEYVLPELRKKFGMKTRRGRVAVSAAEWLLPTFGAMLPIQPVMLSLSGGFSFATLISNLIITPFASGAIVLSVLATLLSLAVPINLNVFYYPARLLLRYIIGMSGFMADMDFLHFGIGEKYSYILTGIVLLYFAVVVFASRRVRVSAFAAFATACLLFFSGVFVSSFMQRESTEIRVFDTGNGIAVLLSDSGENLLVGCGGTSFSGGMKIGNALSRSGSFDALILPDATEYSSAFAVDLFKENRPRELICDEMPENLHLLSGGCEIRPISETYTTDNFTVSFCEMNGTSLVLVENENISSLICPFPIDESELVPERFRDAQLVISRSDYPSDIADYAADFTVICAENRRGLTIQNELHSKGIPCAATGGCGDLLITAEDGVMSVCRE